MPRFLLRFSVALACLALALLTGARPALAKPVSPELLGRLATYAQAFEEQRKRASYHLDGKLEVLDGDGKVTETKELAARVDATGGDPKLVVLKYTEDGEDKTSDAVKEAAENAAKHRRKKASGKELKLPILATQQARYGFDELERSEDGARLRIQFTPLAPAEDTVEGSAWVDVAAGTVLSASFRLSKTSLFVHYVHFTVEFSAQTSLGPAASTVTVDGEGGILFFRRRFRGAATLSAYSIAP